MASLRAIGRFVAVVVWLLAIKSAAAQDVTSADSFTDQQLVSIEPKDPPKPVDRLAEAAEVSAARIVVGVMSAVADSALDSQPGGIVARFPQNWANEDTTVCARLISSDALYEGRAEYVLLPHTERHRAQLEFESAYWEILQERGAHRLAVAVTKGSCDTASNEFVPAALGTDQPSEPQAFEILVNSQGASRVYAEVTAPSSLRNSYVCNQAQGESGVGYDRICRIEFDTPPAARTIHLRINRLNFGAFEDPVDLQVYVPVDE